MPVSRRVEETVEEIVPGLDAYRADLHGVVAARVNLPAG